MDLPIINIIKAKYINCEPSDPSVIYFTTEELIEVVSEVLPVSSFEDGFTAALQEAGFTFHDIGTNEIMLRWCFKLKNF